MSANVRPAIAHRPEQRKQAVQVLFGWLQSQWQEKAALFQGRRRRHRKLAELARQQRKEGQDGLDIPLDLRVIAAKAARRLAPFNKSVLDAAEFYASHLERESSSIHVSDAIEDYLNSKVRAGFSERHQRDIRGRIGRFGKSFGVRLIRTVTVREVEDWLHGLSLGPQSLVNYRAVVHAFFAHGVKRRLVESNPIGAIDKVKLVDKAPEILTPEQLFELLSAAPFDLTPVLAIQAFAGLRTAETMRLDWSEVDQVRGYIMVSAKKTKTARRRLIPIANNLAQYVRHSRPMRLYWSHRSCCVIYSATRSSEKYWRRLQGFELIPKVITGVQFVDGEEQTEHAA